MAPVGECKCTLCISIDPVEKDHFGKRAFFNNFDLYPLKHEPEIGCLYENLVDLGRYRKDPTAEQYSSQQYCLDKCQCILCVRRHEERRTGSSNLVPYYTDFAWLCLACRRHMLEY